MHMRTRMIVSTLAIVTMIAGFFGGLVSPAHASGYITLSSFSGTPAVTLQVSGGGLNAGDTVNFYLGTVSNKVGMTTVNPDTTFGPFAVTVPANAPQGPLSVIGIDAQTNTQLTNSYYVNPFTPTITPTNKVNTPASVLNVSGSGFAPSETVTIALAGASSTVSADSTGSFTNGHITIPNVSAQTYTLTGTGNASNAQAIAYFYVGAFFPSTYPSTYYVLPTQPISFSGSGFAPSETINVTAVNSSTILSTFSTAADGTFLNAGTLSAPVSAAGTTSTFVLTGLTSHATASTSVGIGQFYPSVTPSAYYVSPSGSLSFSGSGFAASEVVNVYEGINITQPLATFTTSATGSYLNTGSIVLPYTFSGSNRTFRLIGQLSHAEGDVTVTVGQYYPTISPSAYFINPGQTLTVGGNGFASMEKVDITIGGAAPVQTTASLLGTFSATAITVPFTSMSYLTLTAFGESSHATAVTTISLGSYFPTVAPSSWYVMPGDSISFTGSGFAPSENVTVAVTNSPLVTPTTLQIVSSNSLGNITVSNVSVPVNGSTSLTYSFTGSLSYAKGSVTIGVAPLNPNVSADNYYVLPGSIVNITGTSFAKGENVTVTAGSFTTTVATDMNGNTPIIPVTVPFGITTGNLTITLTGQSSHVSASTIVILASFYPGVNASTYYTAPGTSVSFTGSGFAANEVVNATLNGAAVGQATATKLGAVTFTPIQIPFSTKTSANFVFTGASSKASVSISVGLSGYYAGVILNNYYAVGGTNIMVSGSGFAPSEPVQVSFGSSVLGTANADGLGSFTKSVQVPYGTTGQVTVTATGTISGASASTTFTRAPVYVSASLGAYAGPAGSTITFIGSGFFPNEQINVTTDRTGSAAVTTFTADANGSTILVCFFKFDTQESFV